MEFIKNQTISFYKMSTISEEFDVAETVLNYDLRGLYLSSGNSIHQSNHSFDIKGANLTADLFYSFCGC